VTVASVWFSRSIFTFLLAYRLQATPSAVLHQAAGELVDDDDSPSLTM
jgi:hypothetical protein